MLPYSPDVTPREGTVTTQVTFRDRAETPGGRPWGTRAGVQAHTFLQPGCTWPRCTGRGRGWKAPESCFRPPTCRPPWRAQASLSSCPRAPVVEFPREGRQLCSLCKKSRESETQDLQPACGGHHSHKLSSYLHPCLVATAKKEA